MDSWEDTVWREFATNQLVQDLAEDSEYPIYRGEEDLETVQKSDSSMIAVVSADSPVIVYVPRKKFQNGAISLNADDLFDLANLP